MDHCPAAAERGITHQLYSLLLLEMQVVYQSLKNLLPSILLIRLYKSCLIRTLMKKGLPRRDHWMYHLALPLLLMSANWLIQTTLRRICTGNGFTRDPTLTSSFARMTTIVLTLKRLLLVQVGKMYTIFDVSIVCTPATMRSEESWHFFMVSYYIQTKYIMCSMML